MKYGQESIVTKELAHRFERSGKHQPIIVLGGMGVDISSKRLAAEVAAHGEFGTLSETSGAVRIARHLQDGDPNGDIHESLRQFPNQAMVDHVLEKFYRQAPPDGTAPKTKGKKYRPVPKYLLENHHESGFTVPLVEMLTVLDAFEQVVTARRLSGGKGYLGINGLGKIPLPTAAALYGAMVAGVDYTARGAGARTDIPQVVEQLYAGETVHYPIAVDYSRGTAYEHATVTFDPQPYGATPQSKPEFWAIAGTTEGARAYLDTGAQAIVFERGTAGGHNMPHGIKESSYEEFLGLDAPVILAGGAAQQYAMVTEMGGAGIQVGSLFAVANESGMVAAERGKVKINAQMDRLVVRSDEGVSPTGYPFQVAEIGGTLSDPQVKESRPRICDISALRTPYVSDGELHWRCPADVAENMADAFKGPFAAKRIGEAACLCNALWAAAGAGQQDYGRGSKEPSIVTLGQHASNDIRDYMARYGRDITAANVISYIRTR
ncbi:MAG: hypothetical protein WAQ25_03430 [Candidatus Saccharimonas sp.]